MISEMIRILRDEAGISQEELARALNVSRQAISKWESSNGLPDIDNIIALADHFGVSIDYLLERTPKNTEMGGSQSTNGNAPACLTQFPTTLPDYALSISDRLGLGFPLVWREIDGMHSLRDVGNEETYALYSYPKRQIVCVQNYRATMRAAMDGTEGILIEGSTYLGDGTHYCNYKSYQAVSGETILPMKLSLEIPIGKRVQLFKAPSEELRRLPQQAWSRGRASDAWIPGSRIPSQGLEALSPEYQLPGIASWNENEIWLANSTAEPREEKQHEFLDEAGSYNLTIGNEEHLCIRLLRISRYSDALSLTEYYVTAAGRTVLERVFVGRDSGMENALKDGEIMMIDGERLVHLKDRICTLTLGLTK